MPFRMSLWRISGNKLVEIGQPTLGSEQRLEEWIARDSSILGGELLIVGRQVTTEFGGRIDLLGIDRQGDTVILELKRERTPREVVAQILDYAAWVRQLTYAGLDAIATSYLKKSLSAAFSEFFGEAMPDKINANHRMLIAASELDEASERIVQYLADEHDVNINVVFFSFFRDGDAELLGRAWLMDPENVEERARTRTQPPWTGYWFVNVGEGPHRNWDDNLRYGYLGAGQGRPYSGALKRLQVGDKLFAYMKGLGYVGYGEVTGEATMIGDFLVESEGKSLLELPLNVPHADENVGDPELSEWAVGVKWIKTFPREEAKTFRGAFANQNVVCKLRHPATLEFLKAKFDVKE